MKKVKLYEKMRPLTTIFKNKLSHKTTSSISVDPWPASARQVRAIITAMSFSLLLSLLGVACQSTAPRVGPMTPDTIIAEKKAVQDKTRRDLENDKRWHSLIDQIGAPFEIDPFK